MGVAERTSVNGREELIWDVNRRVTANFVWSILSEAVGRGVFFATNIYLARKLGVSNFGLFTLAQTLTFYFWFAVDLGTNVYGIREIAKNKDAPHDIINPLFTIRIVAGLVIFAVYALTLFFINTSTVNKLTFLGCGLYLITYAFYSDWVLKGLEKFQYIAYGSIVGSFFLLIFTIYFVTNPDNVALASFIWSLSYLLGSLSLAYFLYKKLNIKYQACFDLKLWLAHLRESIHFTISGSLVVIYHNLPIFLLSIFLTTYEVGIFSAPFRIILTLVSAGLLIPGAFYPVLSELYQSDKQGFLSTSNRLLMVSILFGLPMGVLGTVFAKEAIKFLVGTQYAASVIIFQIMVWLAPLHFVRNAYRTSLLAAGLQRPQNWGLFLGLVGVALTGLIFIPVNGVIGAVVSLMIAEAIILVSMMLIYIYALKRRCQTVLVGE